jgi:hypothetical protein
VATLTAKVTESITMDSGTIDSTNTLTIASIVDAVKRTVTVDTTEMTLLAFGQHGATDSGLSTTVGTFDRDAVRYIRITNLNGTNHIWLTFEFEVDTNSPEFLLKLDKGQSFLLNPDLATGVVDIGDAHSTDVATSNLLDMLTIKAIADSAACQLEVFVASATPSEA